MHKPMHGYGYTSVYNFILIFFHRLNFLKYSACWIKVFQVYKFIIKRGSTVSGPIWNFSEYQMLLNVEKTLSALVRLRKSI